MLGEHPQELVEALRHRRVRVDLVTQSGGRDPMPHRQRDQIDDLLGIVAQQSGTQDLVGGSIDHHLHHPGGLADDAGPGHGGQLDHGARSDAEAARSGRYC